MALMSFQREIQARMYQFNKRERYIISIIVFTNKWVIAWFYKKLFCKNWYTKFIVNKTKLNLISIELKVFFLSQLLPCSSLCFELERNQLLMRATDKQKILVIIWCLPLPSYGKLCRTRSMQQITKAPPNLMVWPGFSNLHLSAEILYTSIGKVWKHHPGTIVPYNSS